MVIRDTVKEKKVSVSIEFEVKHSGSDMERLENDSREFRVALKLPRNGRSYIALTNKYLR